MEMLGQKSFAELGQFFDTYKNVIEMALEDEEEYKEKIAPLFKALKKNKHFIEEISEFTQATNGFNIIVKCFVDLEKTMLDRIQKLEDDMTQIKQMSGEMYTQSLQNFLILTQFISTCFPEKSELVKKNVEATGEEMLRHMGLDNSNAGGLKT